MIPDDPPPPSTEPPPPPRAGESLRVRYTGPDPIVTALTSLLLPGVGQILAGQVTKGVVILVLALCTGCGVGLVNVLAAADAYAITKRRVAGEAVGDWQFF